MKISVTVQFHNELEFLPGWFDSALKYADEIIAGSHNATDGSLEFVRDMKEKVGIPITILEFPEDTVYQHGFSYMKNAMLKHTTGDYVVCLDADEEMEIVKDTFPDICKNFKAISTRTLHVYDAEPHWTLNNRAEIRRDAKWERQQHWRILKNGIKIHWAGLIHESMRLSTGQHAAIASKHAEINMYHFGVMANPAKRTFKDGLYAELLLRAYENENLRLGTDKWWFNVYVPEHREKLLKDREEYRKSLK